MRRWRGGDGDVVLGPRMVTNENMVVPRKPVT